MDEKEQRFMIGGGDYWDDHGIWATDSAGNWYWTRTSQGDGYYYGDSRAGSPGYEISSFGIEDYGTGSSGVGSWGLGWGDYTLSQYIHWQGYWPGGHINGLGFIPSDDAIAKYTSTSAYSSVTFDSGYNNDDPILQLYRERVAALAPLLKSEVERFGFDMSNVPLVYGDGILSNAIFYQGMIVLSEKALRKDVKDVISIALHEAIHRRDDVYAEKTYVWLSQPIRLENIPAEFDNYLKKVCTFNGYYDQAEYVSHTTVDSIFFSRILCE